jgi:hypothetical protein
MVFVVERIVRIRCTCKLINKTEYTRYNNNTHLMVWVVHLTSLLEQLDEVQQSMSTVTVRWGTAINAVLSDKSTETVRWGTAINVVLSDKSTGTVRVPDIQ